MQQGEIVKKILVVKQGKRIKSLYGLVGDVRPLDSKSVEFLIDGKSYRLQAEAVKLLPNH